MRSGPGAGRRIDLDADLTLGRSESGPGNLGNDGELSRRHAQIRYENGAAIIEDLGSSNGTFVNGTQITGPRRLRPGDEVMVGMSTLRYADVGSTVVGRPLPTPPPAGGDPPASGATPPPPPPPRPPARAPQAPATLEPFAPRTAAGPTEKRRRSVPLVALLAVLALGIAGVVAAVLLAGDDNGATTVAARAGAKASGPLVDASAGVPPDGSTKCVKADNGAPGPGHFLFITSACENNTSTVATFPLHRGVSHGQTVWYVITDDSDQADAEANGANYVPKLTNSIGTTAVQRVTVHNGVVDFPATVTFGEKRAVKPGPNAFPPAVATPGSTGEAKYSPLIEMPDGTVLNAPQVANASGRADKVLALDTKKMTVEYVETEGRYENKVVHYASFDSSNTIAATLEDATYAPALSAVPRADKDGLKNSSRERLIAFVNGPTGADDQERQGENSTVLDGLDPHNILQEVPVLPEHSDVGDLRYAPMWDVHLAEWTPAAVADGARTEVRNADDIDALVAQKVITGPGATAFKSAGFVVNCPLISIDLP